MASRLLKNVCVCLCFQTISYQFASLNSFFLRGTTNVTIFPKPDQSDTRDARPTTIASKLHYLLCEIDKSNTSRRLDLDFSFVVPPVCGYWKLAKTKFVLGGVPAKQEELPWMALLGYKKHQTGTMSWRCGGSLVSQRHVLTAAHCIHKQENELYLVLLGEVNISLREDEASSVEVPIKKAIKHEDYDVLTRTNDIGLLILEKDVEFTKFIRPICLPKWEENSSESFVDYKAVIAGWGISEFNGPPESHLQMTQVLVVNNSICAHSYSGYPIIIDDRLLCAGHRKRRSGPCNGDSGGPLAIQFYDEKLEDWYYYQIGIYVSSGGCADVRFPGVYTRVTYYLPWIQTYMSGNMD